MCARSLQVFRSYAAKASPLVMKHRITPVLRADNVPTPTENATQRATKFFETCDARVTHVMHEKYRLDDEIPAVMFMGRSNVGKSSLINGLIYPRNHDTTRKKSVYARASKTPGYTKSVNVHLCYKGKEQKFRLIDTPGYGFGSKLEHGAIVEQVLANQRQLRRVYVLIDSKLGVKDTDASVFDMLANAGVPWSIILTKIDKLATGTDDVQVRGQTRKALSAESAANINSVVQNTYDRVLSMSNGENLAVMEEVFATSTTPRLKYFGIRELRAAIYTAVGLS